MAKRPPPRVNLDMGRPEKGKEKFMSTVQARMKRFARGVSVAYANDPSVRIGEVHTPSGIHNPQVMVTLLTGGNRLIHFEYLEVWTGK